MAQSANAPESPASRTAAAVVARTHSRFMAISPERVVARANSLMAFVRTLLDNASLANHANGLTEAMAEMRHAHAAAMSAMAANDNGPAVSAGVSVNDNKIKATG